MMRIFKHTTRLALKFTVLLPLGFAACQTTPSIKSGEISVKDDSAIVIVKTNKMKGFDRVLFNQRLNGGYSLELGAVGNNLIVPAKTGSNYFVAKVKPGTYAAKHAPLQKAWAACFNRETVTFTIQPGTVNYLGELDLTDVYLDVQKRIIEAGDQKIRKSQNDFEISRYYQNMETAPRLNGAGSEDEARRAQKSLEQMGRKFDTDIQTTDVSIGSFKPSRRGFGTKAC